MWNEDDGRHDTNLIRLLDYQRAGNNGGGWNKEKGVHAGADA